MVVLSKAAKLDRIMFQLYSVSMGTVLYTNMRSNSNSRVTDWVVQKATGLKAEMAAHVSTILLLLLLV